MTEPARHLTDLVVCRTARVVSYVAEALRDKPNRKGTLHGFEVPYVFDLPAAVVKDKVTGADKAMGATASAY